MQQLLERSGRILERVENRFERYLLHHANWQNRLIGIKGSRGTGKTTLVLQHLNNQKLAPNQGSYWSLDDLYFSKNSLLETAEEFIAGGGQLLILDEVHKYSGWAREIKKIYDFYPNLKIVFTGSSILNVTMGEADLSRRALMYDLHGLSYREYLKFNGLYDLPLLKWEDLLDGNLKENFPKNFKPYEHFSDYLRFGYYPFFKEDPDGFLTRLRQTVRFIIEFDMSEIRGFNRGNTGKLLQLLGIISAQVPFTPNLTQLAEKSRIHRNTLPSYLEYLEKALIINQLYASGTHINTLKKPEKIYLDNANLMYALADREVQIGHVRETFVSTMLRFSHQITLPKKGDFLVNDEILLEVGGRGKSDSQIKGERNAYLVRDGQEILLKNSIPIWMLGMMY